MLPFLLRSYPFRVSVPLFASEFMHSFVRPGEARAEAEPPLHRQLRTPPVAPGRGTDYAQSPY